MTNHTIRADTSARNALDRLGISDYLNQNGVTEVIINRPNEVFLESTAGWQRLEDKRLDLKALEHLAKYPVRVQQQTHFPCQSYSFGNFA